MTMTSEGANHIEILLKVRKSESAKTQPEPEQTKRLLAALMSRLGDQWACNRANEARPRRDEVRKSMRSWESLRGGPELGE